VVKENDAHRLLKPVTLKQLIKRCISCKILARP